jgi:DNA-binding transcriptional regulator YhcF (GntR family)
MQIEKVIQSKQYEILREHGLINETAARDLEIRRKFRERIALDKTRGWKKQVKEQLADEYNIGISGINNILYNLKKRLVNKPIYK